MAATLSQIYLHLIIAVKGLKKVPDENRADLFAQVGEIVRSKGQKVITLNGAGDHVHIFLTLKPDMAVSDLVRDIKNNATNHYNRMYKPEERFSWHPGYAAFTYGASQVDQMIRYLNNQDEFHKTRSFREEFIDILKKFQLEFDEKSLFPEGAEDTEDKPDKTIRANRRSGRVPIREE